MFEGARPSLWQLRWWRQDLDGEWTRTGLSERNSTKLIDKTKVKQRQEKRVFKELEVEQSDIDMDTRSHESLSH